MASEELDKIKGRIRDAFGELRAIESRHARQEFETKRIERDLAAGIDDGSTLVNEQGKLTSLTETLNGKRAAAGELVKAYELLLRREMVVSVLEHIEATSKEAGKMFADYMAVRDSLRIYDGRTPSQIGKSIFVELKLTHSSVHVIAGFKKALGLSYDDFGVTHTRAARGSLE
jgi:hypothetical protein